MGKRASARSAATVMFVLLTLLTAVFLFPIYWAVTMSFKEKADILVTVPYYFPVRFTLANFSDILRKSSYNIFAYNSAKIAVITTVLCVIIAGMAGFAVQLQGAQDDLKRHLHHPHGARPCVHGAAVHDL